MKLTSAKDAARLAAEAKTRAEAEAAEAAESKRAAARRKKEAAALDKKLSCELLVAAAKGEASLIWTKSAFDLSKLLDRGFLIYERGVFSEYDIDDTINQWRRCNLEAGIFSRTNSPDSSINLVDEKALRKLFGGPKGFESLLNQIWKNILEKILDDYFWIRYEEGLPDYAAEDILVRAVDEAWIGAAKANTIKPEVSFESIHDYDEIYGGSMLSELRQEGIRLMREIEELLETDRKLATHLDYSSIRRLDGITAWRCDFKELSIRAFDEQTPKIFDGRHIENEDGETEFIGSVLHPSAFERRYTQDPTRKIHRTLIDCESLELFWLPLDSDWTPNSEVVDANLLGWMQTETGISFTREVFSMIETAAEDGLTSLELIFTKKSARWTMTDSDGFALTSLHPTLLAMLLSNFDYKTTSNHSEKQYSINVTW